MIDRLAEPSPAGGESLEALARELDDLDERGLVRCVIDARGVRRVALTDAGVAHRRVDALDTRLEHEAP